MTGKEFRAWRLKLGFRSREDASCHFGVRAETVKSWELGRRPVPQYVIRMIHMTVQYQLAVGKQ